MATGKQVQAAKENAEKAQRGARSQRTLAQLPQTTRKALGEQAAKGRARGGKAGHALEVRNRKQLGDVARDMSIAGRAKMGKWVLIDAGRARR